MLSRWHHTTCTASGANSAPNQACLGVQVALGDGRTDLHHQASPSAASRGLSPSLWDPGSKQRGQKSSLRSHNPTNVLQEQSWAPAGGSHPVCHRTGCPPSGGTTGSCSPIIFILTLGVISRQLRLLPPPRSHFLLRFSAPACSSPLSSTSPRRQRPLLDSKGCPSPEGER